MIWRKSRLVESCAENELADERDFCYTEQRDNWYTIMENEPQLSILVPAYNSSATLPLLLDALLADARESLEVIVVDDGSADDTAAVAERYAERDARVRLLKGGHVGVSGARNLALSEARGRFVTFADSDDTVEPGYMQHLVAVAQETGADCVVTGWTRVAADGKMACPLNTAQETDVREPSPEWLAVLPKNACACLYTRAVLERSAARFPLGVHYGEDTVFHYCVRPFCKRIAQTSSVGYLYHVHEQSLTFAAVQNVTGMMTGGDFLLDFYTSREGGMTDCLRRNLLHYVVHALRRGRSMGSHRCALEFNAWAAEMVKRVPFAESDLATLRRKDAELLRTLAAGGNGFGLGYYWRRLSRMIRGGSRG